MKKILSLILFCIVLFFSGIAGASLINPDFQSGDLTGWTSYNTGTGSYVHYSNNDVPLVTTFDTTGSGNSLALQLQVGGPGNDIYGGGGVYQNIYLYPGSFSVTMNVAQDAFRYGNAAGNWWGIYLNDLGFGSLEFPQIQQYAVQRAVLSGTTTILSEGNYIFRIVSQRNYMASGDVPYQYIDDITLRGDALTNGGGVIPEPATMLLLGGGLLGLFGASRRKKKS